MFSWKIVSFYTWHLFINCFCIKYHAFTTSLENNFILNYQGQCVVFIEHIWPKTKLILKIQIRSDFESFNHQKWEEKGRTTKFIYLVSIVYPKERMTKIFSLCLGNTKIWLNLPRNDCQFSSNTNAYTYAWFFLTNLYWYYMI